MDLTDLWNSIKERISPGSTAIQTAPGQTYGPAMSLIGRVPITFSTTHFSNPNQSGEYTPAANAVDAATGDRGSIYINPKSADIQANYAGNVQTPLRHEIAHSVIMNNLTDQQIADLANTNSTYPKIEQGLKAAQRAGDMVQEVPAYMAEPGAAARYGLPQNLQSLYQQHLLQQLQNISPQGASQYRQLIGK